MDPLSITAGATTLAAFCLKVSALLYGFMTDVQHIDTNVKALCEEVTSLSRLADAISKSWKHDTLVATAAAGPYGNLWASVKAALEDCQGTLEQLLRKIDEVQQSNLVGRGILRRPVKNIKFNIRSKDILTFQQRVRSHSIAMQGGLQMIQLCLLLASSSSLEEVGRGVSSLQAQVCRMESTLQNRDNFPPPPDVQQEETRIDHNFKQLVRAAKSLHSDASTVILTGAGSTVWGGSVMGEPLSQDAFNQIEAWIPPPTPEARRSQDGLSPMPTSPSPAFRTDSSDSESDIEKDIIKKVDEMAAAKFTSKDYEKVATLLHKLVDYSFRHGKSQEEITKIEMKLACVYGLQSKWHDAETIIERTTGMGQADNFLCHTLHALALWHLREQKFELAEKHCKVAIKGKRKLLGRTHSSSYESIALLARIYDAAGDAVKSEGCRSLLPMDYSHDMDSQPVGYMSVNIPSINISAAEAANTSATRLCSISQSVQLAHSDTVNQPAVLDLPSPEPDAHRSATPSTNTTEAIVQLPMRSVAQRDSTISSVHVPPPETTLPEHSWLASQPAPLLETSGKNIAKPQVIESVSKVGLDDQPDADRQTSASTMVTDPAPEKEITLVKWGERDINKAGRNIQHTLVATKHLLTTFTRWSEGIADEEAVSDVYVRLGYELNLLCRHLKSLSIETSELEPITDELRIILEEALAQPASRQTLDRYLPRVRDVCINLLQGLKKKQQQLGVKTKPLPPHGADPKDSPGSNDRPPSEGFYLPKPGSDSEIEQQFIELMEKRGWQTIPLATKREMLAYPPAKKWTLVHQDKLVREEVKEYIKQIEDKTITGKRLRSLSACLWANSWTMQFVELQGHAALTKLLTLIQAPRTNDSAHTLVPTPNDKDLDQEYDIVKCVKALMNNRYGTDTALEQGELLIALVKCLTSPRVTTRNMASMILTFLCHRKDQQGHLKVFLTMDHVTREQQENGPFDSWMRVVKTSIKSRGRMVSTAGIDLESLLKEYAITTLFLINTVVDAPEGDLQLRIQIREQFNSAGIKGILLGMEAFNYDIIDKQIKRYRENEAAHYGNLLKEGKKKAGAADDC